MPVAEWGVLIADDEPVARRGVRQLLAAYPAFAVVGECRNGSEVLRALDDLRPQVVFLDIAMPGMDGYETARRLRSTVEGRDVSLVALTGWGQDEDRRRSKAEGFARHLLKPVDADSLRAILLSLDAIRREGVGGIPR